MTVPQHLHEVTADWIDAILRAEDAIGDNTVTGVQYNPIGEDTGFLSQTVRVNLEYEGSAGDAPRSVVVKIEPESGAFQAAERGIRAFEREIQFYRDVANRVSLRLPHVFHSEVDKSGRVLVMEDLSNLENGDQVQGLRHDQVLAVVREIAKLHAEFWSSSELNAMSWMPEHEGLLAEGYQEHWSSFARAYAHRIGGDAIRLGEQVADRLDQLEAEIAKRPMTMIHCDLRADNLLFGNDDEVVILDWQLANRSLGAIDPARLMGGSEPAALRRGHQLEVFDTWHAALVQWGVRNYPREQALRDMQLAALHCVLIPVKVLSLNGGKVPAGRAGRLLDVQAERFFASALELAADAVLPK